VEDTTGNVMDGISLGLFLYILEGLRYLFRDECRQRAKQERKKAAL
jgi:hypothetical protein